MPPEIPKDTMWANKTNKATFGLSLIEAFEFCARAFGRMEESDRLKAEKSKTGRRAAIEHTKRKHEGQDD